MARIVVFARDTGNPDSYHVGDVVCVVGDGEFLGADIERGYPAGFKEESWWRIIEMPGVDPDHPDIQALLFRDRGNSADPNFTDLGLKTPKRQRKLDLATLEADAGVSAIGEPIMLPVAKDAVALTPLSDATETKPLMPASAVIG